MARCPECQTEQSADFGMTTCPQCSAVFMIGIDGQVDSAEAPNYDEPEHQPIDEPIVQPSEEPTTLQPYEPQNDDFVETFADATEEKASEEFIEGNSVNDIENEEQGGDKNDVNTDVNTVDEYSENFLDNLSDNKVTPVSATDPLDIQRFDESAASQMDDGEYVYEVIITGIDSADLKKDIIMALSEKRFSLIVSELQKEIQKGELIVRNLNPVRAMLIVLRLQSLDVIVEWRQKHFTQAAAAKKGEVEI